MRFFALKNQFVLSTSEMLSPVFAIDGPVRSLYFSIFFLFRTLSPLPGPFGSLAAPACRGFLSTTTIGYHGSVAVSRKKYAGKNMQGTKRQVPGVGVGQQGPGRVEMSMTHYTTNHRLCGRRDRKRPSAEGSLRPLVCPVSWYERCRERRE